MTNRIFLKNAVALCVGSLVSALAEIAFKTDLTNRIGAETTGILQLILSICFPACTLAQSGIHIASTRLCAEAVARKDRPLSDVIRACLIYSTGFGTAACAVLFLSAKTAANGVIGFPQAEIPLKILALSLPFQAASAALRGVFLARRKAWQTVAAQIAETAVKIAVTEIPFRSALSGSPAAALCAIAAGTAAGETASCLIGFAFCFSTKSEEPHRIGETQRHNRRKTLSQVVKIAFPCAVSAYLRSGIGATENILVPRGLERSGLSREQALSALGKIDGAAMPVLTFPATVLSVVSKLLVPEITAQTVVGKSNSSAKTVVSTLRNTAIYAAFPALFALLFGREIGQLLYRDPTGGRYISVLAPMIPILYCDSVTDGMMKGYNKQTDSMKINLADSVLRTAATVLILPKTGIAGYIAIQYVGSALNLLCSLLVLKKASKATLPVISGAVLPAVAAAAAVLPVRLLADIFPIEVPIALILSLLAYPIFLLLCGDGIRKRVTQEVRTLRRNGAKKRRLAEFRRSDR